MKLWILIYTILSLTSPVLANDSFSDYFEYEKAFMPIHADEITQHFTSNSKISSKKSIQLFRSINEKLNAQIKANPNKAVLWFSKGLNFKNILLAIEQQKSPASKDIQATINQTSKDMQTSFTKSIQLDQSKKKRLTAKMYGTMKHNLIDNERITALQHELSLGGSGENESNYWFSHWDVIGSLQDEGRFDDAEKALYTMQKELQSAGLGNSQFKQIYQTAKNNLAEEHTLSAKKENTIMTQTTTTSSQKSIPKEAFFRDVKNFFETYLILILVNVFIVLGLFVAYLKRDKV